MKKFTTADTQRNVPIEFELDGVAYTFRPMKRSSGILALLVSDTRSNAKELDRTAQILSWFTKGLSKDHEKKCDDANPTEGCQACDVIRRLADDDDTLEFETVVEAASWLIGEAATRPTT